MNIEAEITALIMTLIGVFTGAVLAFEAGKRSMRRQNAYLEDSSVDHRVQLRLQDVWSNGWQAGHDDADEEWAGVYEEAVRGGAEPREPEPC